MNSDPNSTTKPQARPIRLDYKWVLMLVVSGGSFLSIMDGGMVSIGLPSMIDDLNASASLIVWISLAFFMGSTAPLLPLGRVADTFGRKRMYLWGIVIGGAGLAFSAVSQDPIQLIIARVFGALGSSMVLANDQALLTQAFPASERGRAQGINNMALGLGIGLGFFLGGVLVDYLGWRALFWSRVPLHLLLAVSVWRFIKDDPAGLVGSNGAYKIDFAGVVLLAGFMVSGLLAINQAGRLGITSPIALVSMAITAAIVPVLIIVERRAAFPMLHFQLFSNRVFSSGVAAQMFAQMAHGGWNFLAPFLLITGIGYSATFAGLMILPFQVIRLVLSPVSGAIADKVGTGLPSAIGLIILLGGLLMVTRLGADAPIWQQIVAISIGGGGLAIFLPANNSAIMGFVPLDSLSSASGFLGTSRAIGISAGVALAAAVYVGIIGPVGTVTNGVASSEVVSAVREGLKVLCIVSAFGLFVIGLRGRN